ncbi:MAG: hypothetical protein VCC02_06665 [Myxococcota bacterium]
MGSVSKWITGVVTAVEDTAGAEERAAIPYRLGMPGPDHSVGVYLHVPFCERVCPYCDFAVVGVRQLEASVEARYVEALLRELDARAALFTGRALATIYFGGARHRCSSRLRSSACRLPYEIASAAAMAGGSR